MHSEASPKNLPISLFLIRASVVLMLAPWVADKFINPAHMVGIAESFYGIGGLGSTLVVIIGVAQLLLLACFAAGIARTWSYGLVLLMHSVSTFSSWKQYLDPYTGANLLFFAAWPMLAALVALFLLREHDTLLSVRSRSASTPR